MTTAPIRKLFFGDNLEIMRDEIADDSIDLVYLDPPFNSNRSYNVLFRGDDSRPSQARIEAFDDTWHWTRETEAEYDNLVANRETPREVTKAIDAFRRPLGKNDVMAYLVMMTPRLLEIHRALKPTGAMYLHCDPTASHYLKVICDQVFGPTRFLNEIVWAYRDVGGKTTKYFKRKHDTILAYAKGDEWTHNVQRGPLAVTTQKRYAPYFDADGKITYRTLKESSPGVFASLRSVPDDLDEVCLDRSQGTQLPDWWTDITPVTRRALEGLGFQTQKPVALLERIIKTASDEGAVVLDPFCGSGTTVAAAEGLGRSWIGIDITYLALGLIKQRLRDDYPGIEYEEQGSPKDSVGARALFDLSPESFEMWAVTLAGGRPNPKGGGDEAIDGGIRFLIDKETAGWITISVKGGDNVSVSMVRDLIGTVENEKTEMGVLVTRVPPTKGMLEEAARAGSYVWPFNESRFPKIQIITTDELLRGERPKTPPESGTSEQAPNAIRDADSGEQLSLD